MSRTNCCAYYDPSWLDGKTFNMVYVLQDFFDRSLPFLSSTLNELEEKMNDDMTLDEKNCLHISYLCRELEHRLNMNRTSCYNSLEPPFTVQESRWSQRIPLQTYHDDAWSDPWGKHDPLLAEYDVHLLNVERDGIYRKLVAKARSLIAFFGVINSNQSSIKPKEIGVDACSIVPKPLSAESSCIVPVFPLWKEGSDHISIDVPTEEKEVSSVLSHIDGQEGAVEDSTLSLCIQGKECNNVELVQDYATVKECGSSNTYGDLIQDPVDVKDLVQDFAIGSSNDVSSFSTNIFVSFVTVVYECNNFVLEYFEMEEMEWISSIMVLKARVRVSALAAEGGKDPPSGKDHPWNSGKDPPNTYIELKYCARI